MIRSVIVEDEEKSRKLLSNLLQKYCPDIEVIGTANSAPDGVRIINNEHPDLVFLDIVMPGGDGFNVLEQVTYRSFEVIFTTAYDEYAVRAIQQSALAYLLKPINVDELEEAIEKVKKRQSDRSSEGWFDDKLKRLLENYYYLNVSANKIGIPTQNGIRFVNIKDISHCKADGNYTIVYLTQNPKTEVVSKTLKDFEELLHEYNFIRVHRSFLVNLDYIKEYLRISHTEDLDADGGCVVMLNDHVIPVSRDKRKLLLKRFSRPF